MRIAMTGAAGLVGTALRRELTSAGYSLTLIDRRPIADCGPGETASVVDILDPSALKERLAGCEAVIHLAACTTDAPWPDQISLSVQGAVNLFEAARMSHVKRVIYASSHHVVGMHLRRAPIGNAAILKPDSRYAVGKAFGESIGALYAYKYDMRVLCIRIGNVNTRPIDRRRLGSWISARDLCKLVAIGIESDRFVFEIVYGVSDRTGRQYDNAPAYRLGYAPEDASEPFEAEVRNDDPAPPPGSPRAMLPSELTLGGQFSQEEFVGSPDRLFR